MKEDQYSQKYIKTLKNCKTEEEFRSVINRIYEDGFIDGMTEG